MGPEHTYEAFDKMLPTDFAQQMRKHSRDTFSNFVVSKESITLEVCRYMEHASTVIISDQKKIKDLLEAFRAIVKHEAGCHKSRIGYDGHVHSLAEAAIAKGD